MKTAIFYDLENIGLGVKNDQFEEHFLALFEQIKASVLVGEVVLSRAYMRGGAALTPYQEKIKPVLQKHKVELVLAEAPKGSQNKSQKNLVDFKMGVDVTLAIARRHSIQTVVLATGDNDFGFLCRQIKDMGKNLLVVSRFINTGDTLLQICDDWVDLSGKTRKLSDKLLRKLIDVRITKDYKGQDFLAAFKDFLQTLESDIFIRRYMAEFGLPYHLFVSILYHLGVKMPSPKELGFNSNSHLVGALLHDSPFEFIDSALKYNENKSPMAACNLVSQVARMPTTYSSEKFLHYYDLLEKSGNITEFINYIEFMKRSGIIDGNNLAYRRNFRATIRRHLQKMLAKSGIILDMDHIKKHTDKL
ncbi:MAG: NYN domain-containing protein [Defluviitaleaceae bacterium]|nr:NYN domain-containing protein [Defluviitaleaceae bacterium]